MPFTLYVHWPRWKIVHDLETERRRAVQHHQLLSRGETPEPVDHTLIDDGSIALVNHLGQTAELGNDAIWDRVARGKRQGGIVGQPIDVVPSR